MTQFKNALDQEVVESRVSDFSRMGLGINEIASLAKISAREVMDLLARIEKDECTRYLEAFKSLNGKIKLLAETAGQYDLVYKRAMRSFLTYNRSSAENENFNPSHAMGFLRIAANVTQSKAALFKGSNVLPSSEDEIAGESIQQLVPEALKSFQLENSLNQAQLRRVIDLAGHLRDPEFVASFEVLSNAIEENTSELSDEFLKRLEQQERQREAAIIDMDNDDEDDNAY